MGVNELHTQIDDLQDEKLTNGTWRDRDTPVEDIANRAIDNFQADISELPESDQELAMQRLVNFLNDLGGELTDISELLEVLGPQDTVQNFSLDNGRLMLGADGIYFLDKTIMGDILRNSENLRGMSKDAILRSIWLDMKMTQDSKGRNGVSIEFQDKLNVKTEEIYTALGEHGFTDEEIDNYMLFGPKLLADLTNPDILKFYGDEDNKNDILQSLDTQEEKLYFLQLWDFVNTPENERKELLRNDGVFATTLKEGGISDFMKYLGYLDITNFSESPEVNEKKTEIFDMISEKCDGEELEQVIAIYQVYLEYAGESSNDIDSYLTKLGLFEEMLQDEFKQGWSVVNFIERLTSLALKIKGFSKIGKLLGELRRFKDYATSFNALESSIFAASFCPYAGDCIDMGYGAYKYKNGVNFSGEEVNSFDAGAQMAFGCISLGINVMVPSLGTGVKAFLKGMPEGKIIKTVIEKIAQFMPDLLKILDKFKDDMLSGLKQLKDFFVNNILPVISGEMKHIIALMK